MKHPDETTYQRDALCASIDCLQKAYEMMDVESEEFQECFGNCLILKPKEDFDVILATEVLSEVTGLNLKTSMMLVDDIQEEPIILPTWGYKMDDKLKNEFETNTFNRNSELEVE